MKTQIDEFVKIADNVTAKHWEDSKYTHAAPPIHRADYISDKWARIVTVENGRDSSVYAFVCLKDNTTKALGVVKAGDIHKAASFKAPAKHARGSVLDADMGKCVTPWGIVYLRH